MTFLFFLGIIAFIIYTLGGVVYFFSLDNNHRLTKSEEQMLLNKIRTSNVLFEKGGDGRICSGTLMHWDLQFNWSPFPMNYYFKNVGWVSWFSPVAKELDKREQQCKEEQFKSTLRKYGLAEEDK